MPFESKDLDQLRTELIGEGGLIDKINDLATATDTDRSQKIVPLIGAIIGLVITAIQAAMT